MKLSAEEKERRFRLRQFAKDPVEAAYRQGWSDACALHLPGRSREPLPFPEAYERFLVNMKVKK